MEAYLDGLRQEIDGMEMGICLTKQVFSVEACINDPILESMFEMKVGKMMTKIMLI